jgi:hypothetical protein
MTPGHLGVLHHDVAPRFPPKDEDITDAVLAAIGETHQAAP